jgi:Uma2 family endonuclease
MSVAATNHRKISNGIHARVPQLLNGDHLAVPEFERRYQAMPGDLRAELIEGIVVMAPPISDDHAESNIQLAEVLRRYARATPGVAAGVAGSTRLDGKNEYQPDVFLRIKSGSLAHSRIGADRLIEGAPELVVEIAVSSAGYDLHEKRSVYERNGVCEYMLWQVMDARFHWFALDGGSYVELESREDGVFCSRVFPGLWLNVRALLSGDDLKVMASLEKGLKSAAHKAFLKTLKASN